MDIPQTPEPLTTLDRAVLNNYQRNFPLSSRPYAEIAARLGCSEAEVLATLKRLRTKGAISRVGPVICPHAAGWSTLAAMAVPDTRLEDVAALVSSYRAVNHNYEREHALNLWFVATGADRTEVEAVLMEIEARTGLAVLNLPLEEAFRLDLGFALQWS